jgi:hypothetical protein
LSDFDEGTDGAPWVDAAVRSAEVTSLLAADSAKDVVPSIFATSLEGLLGRFAFLAAFETDLPCLPEITEGSFAGNLAVFARLLLLGALALLLTLLAFGALAVLPRSGALVLAVLLPEAAEPEGTVEEDGNVFPKLAVFTFSDTL